MRHFREVGIDLLKYGFMSALSQMSGLLLLPLLTRVFSVDEYGTVDIIATFIALISTSQKFAFPSALARYFNDSSNLYKQGQFFSTLLVFVASVGLLIVFGISLFSESVAQILLASKQYTEFIRLGCWIALFTSLTSMPEMLLRLERRIVVYNLLGMLSTILYLILALYFVFNKHSGVWGIFFAQFLAYLFILIVELIFVRKYLTFHLSIVELRRAIKFSVPLIPSVLVTWVNSQADRLLLMSFIGLGSVGVFGAATRIAKVVSFLLIVFRQAWQPYSMLLINKMGERNEVYRRILNYYAGVFASMGLILTAISPEVFIFLIPKEYYHGYVVVPWLIGSAILHQSTTMTNLGILINEKTAGISLASWIGMLLNIIIALFLIPKLGISGAAIGAFVAELVFTSLLWWFSVRKSDIRFDTRVIVVILLSYIVGSILLLAISELIVGPMSIIYRVGLVLVFVTLIGYMTIDESVLYLLKMLSKRFRLTFERLSPI